MYFSITGPNRMMEYWEYDSIVVASHAIYHIENKNWACNLKRVFKIPALQMALFLKWHKVDERSSV